MTNLHEEAERLAQYLDDPGRGLVSYDAANTLRALAARLAEVERERDEAREWNRQMVEKAASGGTLDGYRKMGSAVARLQGENEILRHDLARLKESETQAINDAKEARARVAAAYEEAVNVLKLRDTYIAPYDANPYDRGWSRALKTAAERIRALARHEETDALAERDARMFDLGFAYSAEGWNGEHPGDAHITEHYREGRAAAIREDKT